MRGNELGFGGVCGGPRKATIPMRGNERERLAGASEFFLDGATIPMRGNEPGRR